MKNIWLYESGQKVMSASWQHVVPFFSLIQFTTNWKSITTTATNCLCTACQDTWETHSSVCTKVGRLDFGGGFRVKEVAEAAEKVAVAEVASLLAACTTFLEDEMEDEGGKWEFCQVWILKIERLIDLWLWGETAITWGREKGRKTDKNWRKAFLAVCSGILARGPPTDLWVLPLMPDFSYKAVDTPNTLVLFPTLTRPFIFFSASFSWPTPKHRSDSVLVRKTKNML